MKKIILTAVTAVLVLCGTAEARRGENIQYSNHEAGDVWDPIGNILGGGNRGWRSSPHISVRIRHASNKRHHYSSHGSSILSYGRMLQSSGLRVSEHPAFGGVHHVHHGWAHYAGRAIDVNVGRGVNEARSRSMGSRFDAIASRARAAGFTVLWRVAGHYNHMHIQK